MFSMLGYRFLAIGHQSLGHTPPQNGKGRSPVAEQSFGMYNIGIHISGTYRVDLAIEKQRDVICKLFVPYSGKFSNI